MARKPPFQVVSSTAPETDPPRPLRIHGRAVWDRVQAQYLIEDEGGRELLCLAAEAIDRAQECAEAIARDGPVIRGKNGPREHPLLRAELAAMAFAARCLQRLGLNLEPIRPVGRPSGGGFGWTPVA